MHANAVLNQSYSYDISTKHFSKLTTSPCPPKLTWATCKSKCIVYSPLTYTYTEHLHVNWSHSPWYIIDSIQKGAMYTDSGLNCRSNEKKRTKCTLTVHLYRPIIACCVCAKVQCQETQVHCAKKPVTTMLTYPWKCTVLHCNHLGNTWKPLVLMTWYFDYHPR